jgi:Mg-chelatase subunit ChlD
LLLLAALPAIGLLGWRGMSGLGRGRWLLAAALRCGIALLLIGALADVEWARVSERIAVMFLVDCSASVPREAVQQSLNYVNLAAEQQRNAARGDQMGVIAFGGNATIEHAPSNVVQPVLRLETEVDPTQTSLAEAIKLALATLPQDAARRIVILSDGAETRGKALEQARQLAEAGVGIDVAPVTSRRKADVIVEKVQAPSYVKQETPFEVRVVLNNRHAAGEQPRAVPGRLRVVRQSGGVQQLLYDEAYTAEPGKSVAAFRQNADAADFFTYEAEFLPDDPKQDAFHENNAASAFTLVSGKANVLLVEDWSRPGQFKFLLERLREAGLQVTTMPSNELFTDMAELLRYDTVILADVPRTSGEGARVSLFDDAQIEMLARNTQQMGSGLVVLGGPNSYGVGGWTNTELEKALPVDFTIKNAKVVPVGALALVIDHSGSMSGQKLEMSKSAAIAAVKAMGPRDYISVVAFDSEAQIVVPLQRVGESNRAAARITRLGPGGGTNLQPGMEEGYKALTRAQASVKHMIVLTDGQTMGEGYEALAAKMRKQGITTTGVAVGNDAARGLLANIATRGGGKFYFVDNPRAIPRIFLQEARRVARPLVYEEEQGFTPVRTQTHELLQGVEGDLPPLTGFVMTTVKENPLVETPLVSPKHDSKNGTLLATWTYGLGRSVAWTSDVGQRWAQDWPAWENYDKVFSQMVRWSLRPGGETGDFLLDTRWEEGQVRVVVQAFDRDKDFLNHLQMTGNYVDPHRKQHSFRLEQTAPGRYVGQFPAEAAGAYFLAIAPGAGQTPLRAGVNVSQSAEFTHLDPNVSLLTRLADQKPNQGAAGAVLPAITGETEPSALLATNVFRPGLQQPRQLREIWPWLLFTAAGVFLLDVGNRRIQLRWQDTGGRVVNWLASRFRPTLAEAPRDERLERLRARKAAAQASLPGSASLRFEPETPLESSSPPAPLDSPHTDSTIPSQASSAIPPDAASEDTYLDRLRKAKARRT